MDYYQEALRVHKEHRGKLGVISKIPLNNRHDLSIIYTPGVAQPCLEIANNPESVYEYTMKCNTVAVVTDGTAVLGLGDIGPAAALPVMEGKAVLFKRFAGIDAFPICLDTKDTEELITIIKNLAPTFGGINLEDIAAPKCFEIERRVQELVDIPVFHDDQHGTAIVASAAIINALKVVGKSLGSTRIVVNGVGSAGTAIIQMLLSLGVKDILACDRDGIISRQNVEALNYAMKEIAKVTNPNCLCGTLADAMNGADVFVGVSAPNVVSSEMVASMAKDAIVFPMANPEPEVAPEVAKNAGARIVGTGRSDYPNQINNVLVFPGVFKGALQVRAKRITSEMKIAAAYAIAAAVPEDQLSEDNIVPNVFDSSIADRVAAAVAAAWTNCNKVTREGSN